MVDTEIKRSPSADSFCSALSEMENAEERRGNVKEM